MPAMDDTGHGDVIKVGRGVRIPSSDPDQTLEADLYLPIVDGPVPVVVTMHYGRRTMGSRCFRYFAEHGYASVVVDCRGVGGSEGVPRPQLDPREADDGLAILR